MKEMQLIIAIAWLVFWGGFRCMSVTAEVWMADFSSEVNHPRMDEALFTQKTRGVHC